MTMTWKKLIMLLVGLAAVAMLIPVSAVAATHYLSHTTTVTLTNPTYAYAPGKAAVYCPHGYHATGGGYTPKFAGQAIKYTKPVVNAAHDKGWAVAAFDTGNGDNGYVWQIYVVCAY